MSHVVNKKRTTKIFQVRPHLSFQYLSPSHGESCHYEPITLRKWSKANVTTRAFFVLWKNTSSSGSVICWFPSCKEKQGEMRAPVVLIALEKKRPLEAAVASEQSQHVHINTLEWWPPCTGPSSPLLQLPPRLSSFLLRYFRKLATVGPDQEIFVICQYCPIRINSGLEVPRPWMKCILLLGHSV